MNIDTRRAAAQALPVLQAVIPLRRANMRLRLQVAQAAEQELELLLRQQHAIIESQEAAPSQARDRGCVPARPPLWHVQQCAYNVQCEACGVT